MAGYRRPVERGRAGRGRGGSAGDAGQAPRPAQRRHPRPQRSAGVAGLAEVLQPVPPLLVREHLLIMLQDPQATHVAGYQAFKAMGRQVRRGETGIKVLAPITRREPRLDDAGQPVRDDQGRVCAPDPRRRRRSQSRCSTSVRPTVLRCPTPRSARPLSSPDKPPSDCGIDSKASSRNGDSTYVAARTSAARTAIPTSASGSLWSATTSTTPRPSRPSPTKPVT